MDGTHPEALPGLGGTTGAGGRTADQIAPRRQESGDQDDLFEHGVGLGEFHRLQSLGEPYSGGGLSGERAVGQQAQDGGEVGV